MDNLATDISEANAGNAAPEQLPRFMSVKQVAGYLQINEKKVYALVGDGMIPASKITGKWLFPKDLVDQLRKLRDEDNPDGFDRATWQSMVELGWAGSTLVGIPVVAILMDHMGWRAPFLVLGGMGLLLGGYALLILLMLLADPAKQLGGGGSRDPELSQAGGPRGDGVPRAIDVAREAAAAALTEV